MENTNRVYTPTVEEFNKVLNICIGFARTIESISKTDYDKLEKDILDSIERRLKSPFISPTITYDRLLNVIRGYSTILIENYVVNTVATNISTIFL